jgi:hypothetical protein
LKSGGAHGGASAPPTVGELISRTKTTGSHRGHRVHTEKQKRKIQYLSQKLQTIIDSFSDIL